MASHLDTTESLGFIKPVLKQGTTIVAGDAAVFQNRGTMETFLLSNGYTQAQLDVMNKNDLAYAVRVKKGLL